VAVVSLALSLIDHLPAPIEDRLQQELALVDVEVTAVPAEGFAQLSLEQRLTFLREREVTTPAAWLTLSGDEVQVSIATVSGPRANVRLVTVARDVDAATELALGVREILWQLAPPPPAPPPPAPAPSFDARIGAGVVVPTRRLASGPRALLQGEGTWRRGPWSLGGTAALQVGDGQWRVGVGPLARLGPALAAARLDVVRLPWVTWGQLRLEVGGTLGWRRLWAESRVGWAPLRDVVEEEGRAIYDSGRFEWTISIGLRQMRGP